MTRGLTLACLAVGLLVPPVAVAQTRERVKVTGLRLGLPVGPVRSDASRTGIYKPGQWAPVYVDLECTRDTEESLVLIVETRDADDIFTEGSVEIGPMVKGDQRRAEELGRLAYLKPGQTFATVNVRIKGAESGRTYGESGERHTQSIEGPTFVILGVGANLNSIRFPTTDRGEADEAPMAGTRELRGGWVEISQILDVGLLPDQWFGYGAVDLMVLGTGADRAFWEALAAPQHEKRRKAIAEWVRRGGRLVLSVGTNPDVLEALKEIKDILPATVPPGGKRTANRLGFTWQAPGTINGRTGTIAFPGERTDFAVAKLEPRPDRPTKGVLTEGESQTPLAVQGPYGLGRVTVLAFDLDRSPFTDWAGRAAFWENLVNLTGFVLPRDVKFDKYGSRYDEHTGQLQGSLDFFEGVPVVSFGWVALFILIYIVLIGPVDYLFLKKVVKRLEWTWVTFPVIVITVSAGAYFAAYALKGKDLKINKVDVVDIDLAGRRVDGNAWFTLFSPRIQNYTIGIEPAAAGADPAAPGWTTGDPARASRDSLLSWQSNVQPNRYYGGGGGGGLLSKRYRYQSMVDPEDPNRDLYATGLEGVPIQVWTTKAFAAQWTAPIDPAKPPIVAELAESRTAEKTLIGTITNNLPVEQFSHVALFWRGRAYDLGKDFPIGVAKQITFTADPSAQDVREWLGNASRDNPQIRQTNAYVPPSGDPGTTGNPRFQLWPLLFTEAMTDPNRYQASNASLRKLDQSWRFGTDRPEQAVLVLRIGTRNESAQGVSAEDMTRDPMSPSRLWLGQLPTSGKPRPPLVGTLKQETYVRVFIPVKPAAKK